LAEIQPEKCQNGQKTHFLQKGPGVNGLRIITFSSIRFSFAALFFEPQNRRQKKNLNKKLQNSNQTYTFSWVTM